MNTETTETLIVEAWQLQYRLDALLQNYYKTSSRTYFQRLIQDGNVLVNGTVVKKSYRPNVEDEIEVQFIVTPALEVLPENIPLDILYEDEHLLAVNKPAHMVVHPAFGNWTGTFVNALLYYCKSLEQQDTIRPGVVHRLDKETSGVLVACKTIEAHRKLSASFAAREVDKQYLAICVGKPKDMIITAPLGRHPVYRKQMAVLQEGGKHAVTHLHVQQSNKELSLLEITLETGRTHQIRVHLKHIGFPLLGDSTYGSESSNLHFAVERQMLHAASIAFIHPITGSPLVIKAPMPDDMQKVLLKMV